MMNKEPESEDWCFGCKDGGDLFFCDFQGCPKCYHPECVGKTVKRFKNRQKPWTCAWHSCNSCEKSSDVYCYTCETSFCSECIPRPRRFLQIKDKYGLCKECLKLALLIEENKCESRGVKVDFTNLETEEGLFKEYYDIIKVQEGFGAQDIYDAKGRAKTNKKELVGSVSKLCHEDDDVYFEKPPKAKKRSTSSNPDIEFLYSIDKNIPKEPNSPKEPISAKWCFVCKDGGDLVICDFEGCQKPYHHDCVGKSKKFFESKKQWNCDWHFCNDCNKSSHFFCYTCTKSFCDRCFPGAGFIQVKDQFGLCDKCLNLVKLIEKISVGVDVDFTDLETEEGLFKEYYDIIKVEERFQAKDFFTALERGKTKKRQRTDSGAELIDEEEESDNRSCLLTEKKKPHNTKKSKSLTNLDVEKVELQKDSHRNIYASIVVENVKLIYLKKSVLYDLLKEPESFEKKVIGCFVRVKCRFDNVARLHNQLMQINGITKVQGTENSPDFILKFPVVPNETHISLVSDGDFFEDEFEYLKKMLLAGVFKWPKFAELEEKAKILHVDITKDWIKKEVQKSKSLMDRANEKGWRDKYPFYYS